MVFSLTIPGFSLFLFFRSCYIRYHMKAAALAKKNKSFLHSLFFLKLGYPTLKRLCNMCKYFESSFWHEAVLNLWPHANRVYRQYPDYQQTTPRVCNCARMTFSRFTRSECSRPSPTPLTTPSSFCIYSADHISVFLSFNGEKRGRGNSLYFLPFPIHAPTLILPRICALHFR